MPTSRPQWLPITLVALGVAASWVCALAAGDFGPWTVGVLAAGLLPLVGLWWFRRQLDPREVELESQTRQLAAGRQELSTEQQQLRQLQSQLEAEFNNQAIALDKRQQALAKKLATWHEWMEYPEPLDLSAREETSPAEEDAALAALVEKDRELLDLLEGESEILFNNLLENKYTVDGAFQPPLLLADAHEMIRKVARVYQPGVEHPLMHASLEDLTRAGSRACLHFLVVLEQLPLKVQQYNLSDMHRWVRQGVKAYGVYKSARPYMPYLNSAYYLTRFAMGSNPFSLLAWWLASEVASRSAGAVTTRILNQKALAVMHDVVRVIGFEVATIYGGEVRHRDANWLYAAELSELISQFPLSRDSLQHALNEVGGVQLINEYDRIFLYRCLAMQRSAQPGRFRADVCLNGQERQAVATRLEKFFHTYIHGKTERRVSRWRRGVEERLQVKLTLDTKGPTLSRVEQAADAVRSLASFVVAVKEREGGELPALLADSKCLATLSDDHREELLSQLASEPPFFFEQPELDPDSPIAADYLADLVAIAVRTPPLDMPIEPLLVDAGAWLRKTEGQMHTLVNAEYQRLLAQNGGAGLQVSAASARAIVQLLPADAKPQFAFDGVKLRWRPPAERASSDSRGNYCLVGAGQELLLLDCGSPATLAWTGDGDVRLEKAGGLLGSEARLIGGTWLADPESTPPDLVLSAGMMTRFEKHFAPLLAQLGQAK